MLGIMGYCLVFRHISSRMKNFPMITLPLKLSNEAFNQSYSCNHKTTCVRHIKMKMKEQQGNKHHAKLNVYYSLYLRFLNGMYSVEDVLGKITEKDNKNDHFERIFYKNHLFGQLSN